ncbi:flagellar assembly protein FliW [Paenibacillus sp. strain BS8-2]
MSERATRTETFLQTAYGEVTLTEEQIYNFAQGVIGLPSITKYGLLPFADSGLFILQSLEEDLSFVLIPAIKVEKEFSFQVDEETVSQLGVQEPSEVVTMLIVHIVDGLPYINGKAPILVVPSTQRGCQFVINDGNYSVREPLVMKGPEPC